jgi:starch phosphorylase
MSLIEEGHEPAGAHGQPGHRRQLLGQRRGRAAHRAAEVTVCSRLHELWPEKFNNKTNGVTPRRWLAGGQPGPVRLADPQTIGSELGDEPGPSCALERRHAEDPAFQAPVRAGQARQQGAPGHLVRQDCGRRRSTRTRSSTCRSSASTNTSASSSTSCTWCIWRSTTASSDGRRRLVPRVRLSSAARRRPATDMAKLHHPLISMSPRWSTAIRAGGRALKVAFLPNYRVSLAEIIIPGRRSLGADLHRRQGGLGHRQHEVHR